MMDLQFKNISRDLNYDVIIERTGEGILCQDNKQYDIHIRGKEYRMNKDYAQLYIDGMHRSGYNEGDNARRQFISFFTECLNNNDYKRITSGCAVDDEWILGMF